MKSGESMNKALFEMANSLGYDSVSDTVNDISQLLSKFSTFLCEKKKINHYEILCITGNVPAVYQFSKYYFPIRIELNPSYPSYPPTTYVCPTENMCIAKNHKNVDSEGKVYDDYLHSWSFQGQFSLLGLVQRLTKIFSVSPPLFKKRSNRKKSKKNRDLQFPLNTSCTSQPSHHHHTSNQTTSKFGNISESANSKFPNSNFSSVHSSNNQSQSQDLFSNFYGPRESTMSSEFQNFENPPQPQSLYQETPISPQPIQYSNFMGNSYNNNNNNTNMNNQLIMNTENPNSENPMFNMNNDNKNYISNQMQNNFYKQVVSEKNEILNIIVLYPNDDIIKKIAYGKYYSDREIVEMRNIKKDYFIENKYNWIHLATMFNQLFVLKYFVEKLGIPINLATKDGKLNTCLHLAVKYGCLEIVEYLLDHGSSIHLKNSEGFEAPQIVNSKKYPEIFSFFNEYLKRSKEMEDLLKNTDSSIASKEFSSTSSELETKKKIVLKNEISRTSNLKKQEKKKKSRKSRKSKKSKKRENSENEKDSEVNEKERLLKEKEELEKKIQQRKKIMGNMENVFCCPINLEVFEDPVILEESNQTYERCAIERWLETKDTDPMTNMKLTSKKLVPNIAIRQAIEEFKKLI